MNKIISYAAMNAEKPLKPYEIQRRDVGANDIKIEILFCGVCHSDLHTARNEWHNTIYPVVPGHEIVGKVVAIGKKVKNFKVGDLAGVGCLSDACRECSDCKDGLEQYCDHQIFTYNSPDKHTGTVTYGGYSSHIVVNKHFVLHISDQLDLAAVAPLLCAGITTYSPLKHWKVGRKSKVGIVGLGGLGHIAVKLAHAMGAHVVLFTTSPGKVEDAKRLGAHEVVISNNPDEMKVHLKSFDFILDTVSAAHNLDAYTELLKRDGTLCLNGVPEYPHPSPSIFNLIFKRRQIAGSLIGGIKETQKMLDFCAKHNITADIEMIAMKDINKAYERMLKGDVKYRFVIDMATLPSS
jgi:alcohol dehydrogenase (NADP+)